MVIANFLDSSEITTDRLFQWDIGQKIQLLNVGTSTIPTIHFCNKKSDNALVVTSSESNGTYIATIPNSLLAEEHDITAFIYIGDDNEAKTIKVIHIPITKRAKPSSYTYTNDEDVIDFVAISSEIHSLLDGLIITPYDNTKTYKKPNIVYYQGQTHICKSETEISGVLPTDTTKWGLMCKNGANISEITLSDNVLHFKLENNDILDVPLDTIEISIVEEDIIIPQRKLLWSGKTNIGSSTPVVVTSINYDNISEKTFEVVCTNTVLVNESYIFKAKCKGSSVTISHIESLVFEDTSLASYNFEIKITSKQITAHYYKNLYNLSNQEITTKAGLYMEINEIYEIIE